MIIYKVKVVGNAVLPFKYQSPIARDGHAPISKHIALQAMQPPTRKSFELF